jgi:methylitaconate Delta-isomerase
VLPTRRPVDELDVPGIGRIAASLVDIGNAHVFVRACDVGLRGTEMPAEIDRDSALPKRLELIRGAGAVRMGMASSAGAARVETPATPILGIVSPPSDYVSHHAGAAVSAGDVDLVSRVMFMQITHKTYAGTSTVCTGVAARIRGSVVAKVLGPPRNAMELRIGHPAGVIETEALVDGTGDGGLVVRWATLARTARRILDGTVYLDR